MNGEFAVRVTDPGKCYRICDRPMARLQHAVIGPSRASQAEFLALQALDMEVGCGETVGIVGRNGSGKSTLLQLIAGTLTPTTGSVGVRGRLAAMLELGSGFNPDFTGREHVRLNAGVPGLSGPRIDACFNQIVELSEFRPFIDQPVRTYSSGMSMRLACAVAISIDPDVLIVDEALCVGDAARIEQLQRHGTTILFVSHAPGSIVELCDRAILLEGARRLLSGRPKSVVSLYQKLLYAPPGHQASIIDEIRECDRGDSPDPDPGDWPVREAVCILERYEDMPLPASAMRYPERGARIIAPKILECRLCLPVRGRLSASAGGCRDVPGRVGLIARDGRICGFVDRARLSLHDDHAGRRPARLRSMEQMDRLHRDIAADSVDDIDKPDGQSLRQALLVLGSHRSGTSAVTRILNLLGAELGQTLMPGDIDNERGYWENLAFVKGNDVLLRALGISWDAPVQMPPRWHEQAVAERMASILRRRVKREFGQAQMMAVKDPRLCRLAPLWTQVLEDVGFRPVHLLVVRHPREVAASLERRNGFSLEKSYLLWLQYFLDAEAATRGKPRAIVDYADLLRDWRGCVAGIEHALGVQWPRAIDSVAAQVMEFLEPALRHHDYSGEQGRQRRDALAFVDRIHEDAVRAGSMAIPAWLPRREDVGEDYLHLVEIVLAQSNRDHAETSLRARRLELRLQEKDRLAAVAEQTERVSAELLLWKTRLQARERDTCKLYWRKDGFPYREEHAKTCAYGSGDPGINFVADFPPGMAPDFVRIDPSEWPGLFALDRFEFGGEAIADPGALLSMIHGHRIDDDPGTIRFAGLGAEPHVEIDLRKLPQAVKDRDRHRRFGFRVSRIGMQTEIAALARRAGTLEAAMAAQQSDVAKIRGGIEILSISQDQHAEILDALVERLGPALSSLDALHHKIEAHARVADCALHGLAALLESVRSNIDTLHEQVGSQARAMGSMWPDVVGRLNSALSGMDRLQGHVEAQQRASTEVRGELLTRIDMLLAEQQTVSLWAKRRSPSYWWRRWRRS